ncbi:MAG TPA: HIT family protein [Bacteroidales bacterium]|nr:HIT family protein [Bacteroidales bacterium]
MKESKMTGCPFCSESVRQSAYYSNGEFIAIYNIAPVLPGHSLVIPATHYTSIMALDNTALNRFFETARTAVKILMKAFNTDSFDWSIQEKPEAGQTIEHLHLHIVPRLKGDLKRPGDWYPLLQDNDEVIIDSIERARLNPAAMEQIVTELKRIATTIS